MVGAALTIACIFIIMAIMAGTVTAITIPGQILNGIGTVIELFLKTRWWVPWGVILVCVAWLISLYNMRFLMSIVNWVRDLIK